MTDRIKYCCCSVTLYVSLVRSVVMKWESEVQQGIEDNILSGKLGYVCP
jgi:hypothetical protein